MTDNAKNVPVLMYHHVHPLKSPLNVQPDVFERQLATLKNAGYRSLTIEQFADYMNGTPVPDKSVLITFDDGYLNNYTYAYPLLKKYGMTGVLFVVTGWVGDGLPRPTTANADTGDLPASYVHEESKHLVASGETDKVILRWSELQEMDASGVMQIHSHTHTHTRWDKMAADRDEKIARISAELAQCRQLIGQHLGKQDDFICWPQGFFDDDYKQAAREQGFRYFFTTDAYGFNRPLGDKEHIYRIAVSNRSGKWLLNRLFYARDTMAGRLYGKFKKWKKLRREAKKQAREAQA